MLACCYPSRWTAMLRNEEGWGVQPLHACAARRSGTVFVGEFAPQAAFLSDAPGFYGSAFGARVRGGRKGQG